MKKLADALKAEGIEPCHRCPNANICASGLACWQFNQWHRSKRIVTDCFVWERSRRENPELWVPEKSIYHEIFEYENCTANPTSIEMHKHYLSIAKQHRRPVGRQHERA